MKSLPNHPPINISGFNFRL